MFSPLPVFYTPTVNPRTRLWLRPSGSAAASDCALRSSRGGESCSFRPRRGRPESSPQWQPNPPASTWTASLPIIRLIEDIGAGRLAPAAAREAISAISQAPPAPTWLFTLAAAAGAAALAVIFGVQHLPAAALIFVSAGAGAILRRGLALLSANVFLQPFSASLLAGVIGALAVRYDLSSTLRLVAVCPCMVLVPGPHMLNGALDVVKGRIDLGAARLIYAGLVVLAISTGLLLGLAFLGVSLPVDQAGRAVPLWFDTMAAGVAVFAYSVFFSTPLHMLAWPVAVGMPDCQDDYDCGHAVGDCRA